MTICGQSREISVGILSVVVFQIRFCASFEAPGRGELLAAT